jgi:hypothetical protein
VYDDPRNHFRITSPEQFSAEGSPAPPKKTGRGRLGGLAGGFFLVPIVIAVVAGLFVLGNVVTNIVDKDEWKDRGEPVTLPAAVVAPTPTWPRPDTLGPNAKPDAQIRYKLETWVLASAGVLRPISSACDIGAFDGTSATTFDCTVTFDGQKVVYTIQTQPKDAAAFTWTATTEANVVTRQGILAAMVGRYDASSNFTDLRCEPFPDLVLAPVDQPLPQACYVKRWKGKTVKIVIKPNAQGEPTLDKVFQD